jgi:hypothetical protein
MPYRNYGGSDPAEQYAGTPFDAFTGRLNGGALVMQVINQLAALKKQKQQEGWEVEDRDINNRYKEAQISNLYETPQPKEVKPTSKVSSAMVKSLMKRLDYPSESLLEVDSMNDPALAATWAKLQQDFATRENTGMKVPKTPPSQVGKQHLAKLKVALDTVTKRKAPFTAALSQLWGSPDKMIGSEQHVKWLQEENDKIEEQSSAIALMAQEIDETGELSEESQKKLDSILRFRSMYRAPQKKTDAESGLPPGFKIIK